MKTMYEMLGGETQFGDFTVTRDLGIYAGKRHFLLVCGKGHERIAQTFFIRNKAGVCRVCVHEAEHPKRINELTGERLPKPDYRVGKPRIRAKRPVTVRKPRTRPVSLNKSHLPEYRCWVNMKARCTNPNLPTYKYYGARGIKVCQQWVNSFLTFLADVGVRPCTTLSLDRIDNDGDYAPENVRWATHRQQALNKRKRGTAS